MYTVLCKQSVILLTTFNPKWRHCVAVPFSLRLGFFSSLTVLPVWEGQQAQAGNHSRNLSQAAEYSSSLGHHHPTTLHCWFLLTLSECAKRVLGEANMTGWGLEKGGILNEWQSWGGQGELEQDYEGHTDLIACFSNVSPRTDTAIYEILENTRTIAKELSSIRFMFLLVFSSF